MTTIIIFLTIALCCSVALNGFLIKAFKEMNDAFKTLENEYNQLYHAVEESNDYRSHSGFIL